MKAAASLFFLSIGCPSVFFTSEMPLPLVFIAEAIALPVSRDGQREEFLYKFLQENKSDFKKKNRKNSAGAIRRGHVQDAIFSWDWGSRADVGYYNVLDSWNVSACYSRFHATGENATPGLFSSQKNENTSSLSPWKIHLDLADLEMGRVFHPKSTIEVRPHLGIRGAWIYKKIQNKEERSTRWVQGNNCAGLGLRSGLDSLWRFNSAVSLFSDGALSILAGYHNIDKRGQENYERSNIAAAEVSFGVQCEASLARKRLLTFRCGYEMNYLFNQTQWLDRLHHNVSSSREPSPGLSLQGMTLSLRLDF